MARDKEIYKRACELTKQFRETWGYSYPEIARLLSKEFKQPFNNNMVAKMVRRMRDRGEMEPDNKKW